jgi:AraC-like DNA-binding protein
LAEVAFLQERGDLREGLPETGDVFKCGHLIISEIRRSLRRSCRHIEKSSSRLEAPEFRDEIEFDLPRLLLSAMEPSRPEPPRLVSSLRSLSLKEALAYIAEFGREPITVQDLLRATGASERFGVSPKAYLQSLRLNAARKELKNSDPLSAKVADVANQWGFWHMGQFAADYRRHFGELPSETLCQPAKDYT